MKLNHKDGFKSMYEIVDKNIRRTKWIRKKLKFY
ncbi:hypothetical protein CcarbDRAFT_3477 [Clostridium carboxidivorans P7]|uniref:Uncharacterized protein n=1 Tax=Clostridium carboxidivorans P7 TaxID=536227 RepID=C6PXG0_9CLOT|nr:hypothetical protein CcarbDRAFT_3477 [Clostridium carboxidivorans P7]